MKTDVTSKFFFFSIYEPNLEVNIDECMEKEVLDEAQSLCDRINEIEKSVASKGLVTIPLPKPLEEFTWLSLGQTIINLHRYITINNMVRSWFTFPIGKVIVLIYKIIFFRVISRKLI